MLCSVYELGLVGYEEACRLQQVLLRRRLEGAATDSLLLLEHPPVITIGKSGRVENVLASPAELANKGISLVFSGRGGDATYHGPGQLVVYPIIDLKNRGRDVHRYIHELEEVLLRTLADFGIEALRDPGHRGVWVADSEIAAIGLQLKRWVTMHGFALNIDVDLAAFSLINPCGFTDRGATSIADCLAKKVGKAEVTEKLLRHFAKVFDIELVIGSPAFIRELMNEDRDRLLTSQ